MKKQLKLAGKYFCGNEISNYGKEHGFLDYDTFSRAFDHVLNNSILNLDKVLVMDGNWLMALTLIMKKKKLLKSQKFINGILFPIQVRK